LLASLFLIGLASAAVAPTIQTRLMDIANDSQSIAAALNHSALNIANSLGAYLGSVTIAAGLGYLSPVWCGIFLSIAGVSIAAFSFGMEPQRGAARRRIVEARPLLVGDSPGTRSRDFCS
jgi:DHA1 family inner membrane transport protein